MNKPLGPYTPVVRAGDFLYVSGQVGMRDGVLADGGVPGQTAQVVRNITDRLAENGANLTDIVKAMCFLTDMGAFAEFNDAYMLAFGDHRPARSTVEVSALPVGAEVEIEVIAFKPS